MRRENAYVFSPCNVIIQTFIFFARILFCEACFMYISVTKGVEAVMEYKCNMCGDIINISEKDDFGIFINRKEQGKDREIFYCKKCSEYCINTVENDVYRKRRSLFKDIIGFILSFFPGLAHFYLGLPKRAMFFMTVFFAFNYLSDSLFRVFSFGAFVTFLYSFFDFCMYRKKILQGKQVSDDINDIRAAFLKNKKTVMIAVIIVMVIEIFRSLKTYIDGDFPIVVINILLFILVCIGFQIIIAKVRKK